MTAMKIGSPKLGKSASIEGQDFLFPLQVEVENHSPRKLQAPECRMSVSGHGKQTVTIKDADQLKRIVADIEAVAEINGYELAVTLRFQQSEDKKAEAKSEEKPTAETKTVESDTEQSSDKPSVEAKPKPKRGRPAKSTKNQAEDNK